MSEEEERKRLKASFKRFRAAEVRTSDIFDARQHPRKMKG
jgi:hypothetical protein